MTARKRSTKSGGTPVTATEADTRLTELITGDEEPALFTDFDQFLEAYAGALRNAQGTVLRIAWGIGKHVDALLSTAGYGERKIDELVEKFAHSKSTLYSYRQLFVTFSWETLNKVLVTHGIPWRMINKLATISDTETREDILNKLVAGECTVDEAMLMVPAVRAEALQPSETPAPSPSSDKDTSTDVAQASLKARRKAGKLISILEILSGELEGQEDIINQLDIIAADDAGTEEVLEILASLRSAAEEISEQLGCLAAALESV